MLSLLTQASGRSVGVILFEPSSFTLPSPVSSRDMVGGGLPRVNYVFG